MATYAKYRSLGQNAAADAANAAAQDVNVPKIASAQHKMQVVEWTRGNKIAVILLSADWCGPCKMMKPRYAELVRQYTVLGMCELFVENVDDKISTRYAPLEDVSGVPAVQFFYDGKIFGRTMIGPSIEDINGEILHLKNMQSAKLS